MRLRLSYVLMAAVLGVAAAVLPAIASSETSPTIEARNTPAGIYEHHEWAPTEAAVVAGGAVSFSNPTAVPHGIEWVGASKPTCTGGVPVGNTAAAAGTNWSGSCTFTQPGTYIFYCTVHGPEMTGKVVVSANGTTTITTPTTPTGTTTAPPSTTPTEQAPSGSPLNGNPSVRAARHGTSISGSVRIAAAGVGDRLEVDLLASGKALVKHARRVAVGRFVRGSVKVGSQSFTVKLSAAARAALRRAHRLSLTVRVVLTPVYGNPVVRTRAITVHG